MRSTASVLRCIAGTLPRTGGEIRVRGSLVAGPRRDIGIVFQTATLLPWRNVLQNAVLVILGVMGVTLNLLVNWLRWRVIFWQRDGMPPPGV